MKVFEKTLMNKRRYFKQALTAFHMIYIILIGMCSVCNADTENLTSAHYAAPTSSFNPNAQSAAARTILRIYDECGRLEGGFVPCLKKKAISFLDRISQIEAITVADGIKLVRLPGVDTNSMQSDNELEQRSSEDRDSKLTSMLIERLSQFFNRHSLQVNFPKLSSDEIGRSLEEGRGKMKKMMSMMVMGMAMKMMGMIPVAMGGLYMLAGKALIISKIALLLAGIMGLKKLMSGNGGKGATAGYTAGGGGWSSGGGGGGGWDRRSLSGAHDMAYRSYRQLQAQQQQQQQPQQQKQQPLQQNVALPVQQQQQLQQMVQKS